MSMAALKWAREPRPRLGGPATAVLRDLADRANESGVCWPSLATIAAATGYSEPTVRRALRRLEAENLLETKRIYGRSSRYILHVPQSERADTPIRVSGSPLTLSPKASISQREETRDRRNASEEHRTNAAAYQLHAVEPLPDVVRPDPDVLEFARRWLRPNQR